MDENGNRRKDSQQEPHCMTMYMCLGIALGTAIGAATDNLTTWMPVGLALGVGIGSFLDGRRRKEDPPEA